MPRPEAMRLITRARRHPRGLLPFGLRAWSVDADAIAVLLETAQPDLDAAAVLEQVPAARSLAPATPVFVLGRAARSGSPTWFSWVRSGALNVPRAPRCDALLMRGYVGLGAGIDESSGADLVWGFSSPY